MADTTFLCANNCGFFGNRKTLNLCSKCYFQRLFKLENSSTAAAAAKTASPSHRPHPIFSFAVFPSQDGVVSSDSNVASTVGNKTAPCGPSRCSACRKRVGLTGFECRCEATYCGTHRYPEMHSCAFDFKTVGKEAIKKANPLVKAAKLENRL